MKRFKSFNEAVEVDDISVGVKKKLPAGVKANSDVKGYAYNEKVKFKFKGKNPFKINLEEVELEEGRGDVLKSLESLVKRGGYDKKDFQKALDLYKSAKYKDLRKHIYGLDTDPSETLAATIAQGDTKAFTSMYPRAKAGDYLRSIVIQHGESVENTFDSIVEDMMAEIELDEALSPKEKEKRLLMIKKAVEKLNRANIEKVKKQAMRDMKASGMFDDVIDEEAIELDELSPELLRKSAKQALLKRRAAELGGNQSKADKRDRQAGRFAQGAQSRTSRTHPDTIKVIKKDMAPRYIKHDELDKYIKAGWKKSPKRYDKPIKKV